MKHGLRALPLAALAFLAWPQANGAAMGDAPIAAASSAATGVADAAAPLAGLKPAGQGKLTWFGLHIYDARLYVEPGRFDAARLGDSRFALALRYARNLVGEKIAERSDSEMASQGHASPQERAQWLAQMRRIFPDVKAGDTLIGAYSPGEGTRFYFNGRLIGSISGARFAASFFGIWLAADTSEPRLRTALLEGADGQPAR